MQMKGTLEGHKGAVTQIATFARNDKMIVISSSRGKYFNDTVFSILLIKPHREL